MISDPDIAERLAHLDARDKLLRQQMTKQTELSQAQAYIGTCQDMCPERERCLRIGSSLSIFEKDELNQPNESSMIKEYRRAGADQEEPLPHDLRTPEALERTMNYLCYTIMDDPRSKTQELVLHWYDFLWDRLRAIRKDITQQNICDQASAILVERCTRFHIHSCYAMNYVKDFDVDMNKRNLNDCLQMLRQMYTDLRNTGIRCEGELEFQKYDILLHLEEDQLSSNVAMKTSEHRSSADMKYVTQLFYAYTNNYYYKFFKLMLKADYMTSCILSLYVNKVRLNALKIIIASCTSKQPIMYPANSIIEALGFDDLNDLATFASCLNIEMQEKGGKYFLILSKDLINTVRQAGSNLPPLKSNKLVESKKMNKAIGELVHYQPVSRPNLTLSTRSKPPIFSQDLLSASATVGPQLDLDQLSNSPLPNKTTFHNQLAQKDHDEYDHHIERNVIGGHHSFQSDPSGVDSEQTSRSSSSSEEQSNSSDHYTDLQDIKITTAAEVLANSEPEPLQPVDETINPVQQEPEPNQNEQQQVQLQESSDISSPSSSPDTLEPTPSMANAVEIPVCRLRFRQPPRFHPYVHTPDKEEKRKQKRTSFNDSINTLRDEVVDEMKANENLMKIVRMIS